MGVIYQLTVGRLQLLSNSTTCNRIWLMCGPKCAVCLIQFECIMLLFCGFESLIVLTFSGKNI